MHVDDHDDDNEMNSDTENGWKTIHTYIHEGVTYLNVSTRKLASWILWRFGLTFLQFDGRYFYSGLDVVKIQRYLEAATNILCTY